MDSGREEYGMFIVNNGMKKSCERSAKSPEFLLDSLYSVVGKVAACHFFVKGAKDYLKSMDVTELSNKTGVPLELLVRVSEASESIIAQEAENRFQSAQKLQQKVTKLSRIDQYKNIELKKSIIFKHLKSTYQSDLQTHNSP